MAQEQDSASPRKARDHSEWSPYSNLLVHNGLFKKGLVVIKPKIPIRRKARLLSEEEDINNNSFPINERRLCFYPPDNMGESKEDRPSPHAPSVRRAHILFDKLVNIAGLPPHNLNTPFVFNARRREEIFHPLIIDERGIYIFPWTSQNTPPKNFSGFTQFVTAGCLFGSSIQGKNATEHRRQIFKHDMKFSDGEKIQEIVFNLEDLHPYEEMLFHELALFAKIVDKCTMPGKPKRLLYHLPDYDYVLFGVELFIRGRITSEALDILFGSIFLVRDRHIEKIRTIFDQYNIEVTISSPFHALFADFKIADAADAEKILMLLGVPTDEDVPENMRIANERRFVASCLQKLTYDMGTGTKHHQVWQDFIKPEDCETVNDLEKLFKIANAVMIGLGSFEKDACQTCSLLPVSEKQIQVQYAQLAKKHAYPSVFNLTMLDAILAYQRNNCGPLYYFDHGEVTLERLIKQHNALDHAAKNVGFFARSQPREQLELTDIISNANSPPASPQILSLAPGS